MRSARGVGALASIAAIIATIQASAVAAGRNDAEGQGSARAIVVGAGGVLEADLSDRSLHGGGTIFLELAPIEDVLELEVGASALAAEGGLNASLDLLFKKPFKLCGRTELMVGLGPELAWYRSTTKDGAFFGAQVAVDLMFWPTHHAGIWVQPSYELLARKGIEHSMATSAGVLFGW